jgi:capsular exopolysaccharide synthesis family protein
MSISADSAINTGATPASGGDAGDSFHVFSGRDGRTVWFDQSQGWRRAITALRKRMLLFWVVATSVFLCAIVVTIQSTPRYTATANVMLDTRKEQVTDVQAVISGLPADSSVVDTEVEVLKSRQMAERVVTALNLEKDPEFNPALKSKGLIGSLVSGITGLFGAPAQSATAVDTFRQQRSHETVVDSVLSHLAVKRAGLTYVINVGFTSASAPKAAEIANTFADKYLTEQLEAKFEATQQANSWLNEHLADLRGQVESAEAAVQQYKISHNIYSAGSSSLTEAEISNFNQQVALAKAEEAQDDAALKTAQDQLAKGSNAADVGAALDSPVVQQLRAQRAVASSNLAQMAAKYGPRHPEMLKSQRQLTDIDAQIQTEAQRVVSNLQAKAQASRQRTASIVASLSGAKGNLASNNQAEVGLNELQRKADALSSLYKSFLNRFEQTSSEPGVQQTDARIVSRAKIPIAPSAPKPMMNLILGLAFALGAGITMVALAELFDTGLMTADDIEQRLDTPHLASLPLLSSVAEGEGVPPVEFVAAKPLSSFAESFRALRASLRYAKVGSAVKVIVLTSALPGEGKTTTSVCLGRSAALAGDRVVIVDCDLRRRNINKLIGTNTETGLLEVLSGQAKLQEALLQDRDSGAYILPLAQSSFTPKDVFGTVAMDNLLQTLREHFDLVILDTAPTLAVADTRVLAAKADAVVFLARWRRTPQKAIEASLKQLAASGAYIAGVALAQVDMKQQTRYGYGDPSYYYASYKKYYAT